MEEDATDKDMVVGEGLDTDATDKDLDQKCKKCKGFLRKSAEFGKDTFYPTLKKLAQTHY